MKNLTPIILFIGLLISPFTNSIAQTSSIVNPDLVDIPYEKFELENGLTLIVHEDKKAPIVAVNVWYHVGSKNEKVGKSGFAHLFEHLMFNGSEHFNKDYFQALESIGATDLNGTTNNDRTNYFQNVPTAALDQVLWLESDRMGHLLGVIDQERLDEQRGVVQNEKRQGENQPYGRQWNLITEAMYPQGHPYSWTVIGEMDHLNAASLEDVQDWFKTYYGAANAVIVVAGDVDAKDIHEKIKHYFGHIEAGPTLVRPQVNIPRRTGETRSTYEDRVPESRIVMVWNTPEWGTDEADHLDLASSVLGSGKNSRLYKKLVYEDQVASSAFAFTWTKEISGNMVVGVNIKPGADVDKVEASVNEILMDFFKNGPTQAELDRVKAETFAGKIKGLERIGGFGGKSDILAENMVYGGSPDHYKKGLQTLANATIQDIKATCQEWLMDGKHVLIANPFPNYGKGKALADRNRIPEVGPAKSASFPEIQQRTLKNGMKVMLAQRPDVPTVVMNMMFDAGYSTDQMTSPGTAALAMNLLDEGTKSLNALQISDKLSMLGAGISSYSDLDMSYVGLNTLKGSLDESLDLYADVIINPAFPQAEFDRLKKEQMNNIKREKSNPVQMAIRSFPKFLYGEDHPYSQPLTGSGYEDTVEKLQKSDLEKFHSNFIDRIMQLL
jgi:predicted Zn-dependent peptidase